MLDDIADTRGLLLTLNSAIHPEVQKLYPDAEVPRFAVADRGDGVLEMEYWSSRGLCRLAEGLVLGTADHFAERVTVSHERCRSRGDDRCVILVELRGA